MPLGPKRGKGPKSGRGRARGDAREQAVASVLPGFAEVAVLWTDGACTAYSGREPRSGRLVTAAVVDLARLSRELTERLQADLQAVEEMRGHPGIAVPYEVLVEDGRAVILADSRPLYWPEWSGWRSTGETAPPVTNRPIREVLRVATDLAGALADAHAKALVHRDLRPGTILASPEGKPSLGAFAVSSVRGSAPVATALSSHCPWHIAPETLESGTAEPPGDVYGLGSTIYQVLAGRPPFPVYDEESRAALIVRILRDPITPLPGTEAPPDLQRLLAEMMAKDPAARPSARDAQSRFADLLAAASDTAPMVTQKRQPVVLPTPVNTASDMGGPGPRWPTVVPPAEAERHVVVPPTAKRGQPSNPLEPADPPLEPLGQERRPLGSPVYVDPSLADPEVSDPAPLLAPTIGGRRAPARSAAAPSTPRLGGIGLWVVAGIAGVVVVIVVVLLVAGVL